MSLVHCPAARIASLMVQEPLFRAIAVFVYFVVVYMRQTASRAPGHRPPTSSAHFSGSKHSKMKATHQ